MGTKKGPWTPEEDEILVSHIRRYGYDNWCALPKQAGLLRCGKICRLQWTNYVHPVIKRENFSLEEEETITKLHQVLGNRSHSSALTATLTQPTHMINASRNTPEMYELKNCSTTTSTTSKFKGIQQNMVEPMDGDILSVNDDVVF
ncbi:hypothetical protein LguiA_016613 [Lonicera macranthoides]